MNVGEPSRGTGNGQRTGGRVGIRQGAPNGGSQPAQERFSGVGGPAHPSKINCPAFCDTAAWGYSATGPGGVDTTARSYQSGGTSTAERRPCRVKATCCRIHCTVFSVSANRRRTSSTFISTAMHMDGTHLIVCTERTDRKVAPLHNPEASSVEFWTWFEGGAKPAEPEEPRERTDSRHWAITGSGKRRSPRIAQRRHILGKQRNRCLYCGFQFGAVVLRKSKPVVLQLNWDHFVPYAYGLTNADTNWVAACHICNGIKSCRMFFDTVAEAQQFIREGWERKGYRASVIDPGPRRPRPAEEPEHTCDLGSRRAASRTFRCPICLRRKPIRPDGALLGHSRPTTENIYGWVKCTRDPRPFRRLVGADVRPRPPFRGERDDYTRPAYIAPN